MKPYAVKTLAIALTVMMVRPVSRAIAEQLTPTQVAQYAYNAGFRNDSLITAVAVAGPESGYRTDAKNTANKDGSVDIGLWQINSVHGYSETCLYDAQCNADAAFTVSGQGTNFNPWSVYKNSLYLGYLDRANQATAAVQGCGAGWRPSGWVQFGFNGAHKGTEAEPLNDLNLGICFASNGGTVNIKAGNASGITTLDPGNKTITLAPSGGSVTLTR